MFSKDKVEKIRKGVKVNGKVINFWVETIRQKHSNSWIHLKSYDNSISNIRNVFERLSLRINRIIRTDYGPFRIGKLKNPGDIIETHIPSSVNTYMYYRYKEKLQNSVRKLDETKLEVIKNNMIVEQKNKIEESKIGLDKDNDKEIDIRKNNLYNKYIHHKKLSLDNHNPLKSKLRY